MHYFTKKDNKMMKKHSYVKLLYKQSIDDWAVIHLSELDEKRYEIRAVDIYNLNFPQTIQVEGA